MLRDALPFIFAAGYGIFGPMLDKLVWRDTYKDFYTRNPCNAFDAETLARGASWAVEMASIVPSLLLTLVGVVLLLRHISGVTEVASIVLAVAPFFAIALLKGGTPTLHTGRVRRLWLLKLTTPQALIVGVNAVAIVIALRE